MKVSTILDHIDDGGIALPVFQRGYVWNRDQVRGLFTSLYRGYPVGSFMTWSTGSESAATKGAPTGKDGTIRLLLDGQQRATTLYGVVRGRPPLFFEGNAKAFDGLHFNVVEEAFEFYLPLKMKNSPEWISVTDLFRSGAGQYLQQIGELAGGDSAKIGEYFQRLNDVTSIRDRDMFVEEVTGADKTVDVVVDIFNRVNSGGYQVVQGRPRARQDLRELA